MNYDYGHKVSENAVGAECVEPRMKRSAIQVSDRDLKNRGRLDHGLDGE